MVVFAMVIDFCEIGKTIRNYRIKEEMTQDQLSEYADISPGYLSKIEGGFAKPTLNTLMKIADSLGVTLNDLAYSKIEADNYRIAAGLIDEIIEDCSLVEKELIYLIIKTFVDYLSEHGIRL